MADSTVRDLFRSLEQTLHERLRVIEDVLLLGRKGGSPENVDSLTKIEERLAALEQKSNLNLLAEITQRLAALEEKMEPIQPTSSLLPTHPLEGLEVIPKREVVLPIPAIEENSISLPDRLLLNRHALKALEAREMGEELTEDHPCMNSEDRAETGEENGIEERQETEEAAEDVEDGAAAEETAEETAEVVEDLEDEAPDEEAEEETQELELEEFEYKGATYYRDNENKVYMMDEDGDLMQDPIGMWHPEKQKILKLKPAA